MARTPETPEDKELRNRAFQLFKNNNEDGNKRSKKEIALLLGVSEQRLSYWAKTDTWEDRLLDEPPGDPGSATPDNVKQYLRERLLSHLRTLSGIIEGAAPDRVRIQAVAIFARISNELGALDVDQVPVGSRQDKPLEFDDTLEDKEV